MKKKGKKKSSCEPCVINNMPHSTKRSKVKTSIQQEIFANRYEQLQKLGSGSFGSVFLVSDIKCQRQKKVLKKILIGNLEPDDTIGAVSEARLLAKLDHPGIVKFHDSFISGEFFCIVTEYCEGGDLEMRLNQWKKTGKRVDKPQVITWFVQLLLAVQYLHHRRVLHRDLKARNVFLRKNMVKLGDFGISRILANTTDLATTVTGTPYYMSPELLQHESYDAKSDIWSMGVILYEMCTLRKPFLGENLVGIMYKIVNSEIPSLPQDFDEELQSIYSRMLVRDASMRASAGHILKTPYIVRHLSNMKHEMSATMKGLHRTKTNREAKEIAEALQISNKNKQLESIYLKPPMTAKERMVRRKQEKADKEAERLKKVTEKAYIENRMKFSEIKNEQSKVRISFLNESNDENHCHDNDDIDAMSVFQNGMFSPGSEDVFLNDNSILGDNLIDDINNSMYDNDSVAGESDASLSVISLPNESDATPPKVKRRQYTHCFGEDLSDDEFEMVSDVTLVDDTITSELTSVSDIPDDASTADTFYSSYADFEEDSSENEEKISDDDYDALLGYMEDALELTEHDVIEKPANSPLFHDDGTSSIREQKIKSLKAECVKLLGKSSFERVYKYLSKVRFQTSPTVKEDVIMQHLRKMVGNTRDCFLVDQLIFLEKQNEISEMTVRKVKKKK